MEDNKNINMDIKEATDRAFVDHSDGEAGENSSEKSTLDCEFKNGSQNGLVFEADCLDDSEISTPLDVGTIVEEFNFSDGEKADFSDVEEFLIPDSKEVSARFDSLSKEVEKTTIFTTYIPRFTEASENYRMAGEKPVELKVKENPPHIENSDPVEKIDPTAELPEEAEAEAVIVTSERGVKLEEFAESISIFKFSGEDSALNDDTEAETDLSQEGSATGNGDGSQTDPAASAVGLNDFSSYQLTEKQKTENDVVSQTEEAVAEDNKLAAYTPVAQKRKRARSNEYTALYQRDSFKDRFLDSILSVKVRLASVILLSFAVLFFENIGFLGVDISAALGLARVPYAIHVIDLQFALCLFLLALPEVASAIAQLRNKTVAPELSLVLSVLIVSLCSIANIVICPEEPLYVGFIFAIHVCFVVFGSNLRYLADFSAFKSTSRNSEKYVVDVSPTGSLGKENVALDGAVDSYKSRTVRLLRVSFITDFFKRTGARTESSTANLTVMSISFGVALVCAAAAFFLLDGWISASYALALTYLIGVPLVLFASHKIPYHYAQKIAEVEKTVIIGESSLYEYEDADVITFDDTEIFGADDVVLKRFMLYGDRENVARPMKLMSALFSSVGGPLDNIFANALDKRVLPAQSVGIEDDGICGIVDGKHVSAGNYEYMLRHGVISDRDDASTDIGSDTTKVMYAAEEGTLIAKFYIRYSFSEEFSSLLSQLRANGIVPLIYTRDPNVNNELLKTLTVGQGKMRVLKQYDLPLSTPENILKGSAGIVTFGEKIHAIKAVLLAKRYTTLQSAINIVAYVLMGIGVTAAAVLAFSRVGAPSVFLAAWQLIGCAVLYIMSKRTLDRPKK